MKTIARHLLFAFVVLALAAPAELGAQSKDVGKPKAAPGEPAKPVKKSIAKFIAIENGDTTITEKEIDPDDADGRLRGGREPGDDRVEKNVIIKKQRSGGHGAMMDCCMMEGKKEGKKEGKQCDEDCCRMDGEGHHGKSGMKERAEESETGHEDHDADEDGDEVDDEDDADGEDDDDGDDDGEPRAGMLM